MRKEFFKLSFILLFSVLLYSCYEELTNNPIGNQPPKTGLFLYPDSTISSQPSRLRVHWWGDDPDGLIVGFYFTWDDNNWTFTTSNDSIFALQIGATDTVYTFKVSAVDNGGNGVYDNKIFQNGIDFGPEPFTDLNDNGIWDNGEPFVDIGLIDPNPAEINFPIRNSAPEIYWNILSELPDTSFPVMSIGWEAEDLDGDETIVKINVALNDASAANVISLSGSVRRITIRANDFENPSPLMQVLIDGAENNIHHQLLPGLKFNSDNRIYVQAEDISGAKSGFVSLPDTSKTWYVKKPKGKLLIVDDYATIDNAPAFYNAMFDTLNMSGKYDVLDVANQRLPYINVTFLETIKLFDYVLWYTDNNPSLDIAAVAAQKYIAGGGKILFSMQFPQNIELNLIQSFLTQINPDSSDFRISIIAGTKITADTTRPEYPPLEVTTSLFRVRSFYLNPVGSIPIYYFPNKELRGFIGFADTDKNLFFIGLPLHRLNGGAANVKNLLNKVLFVDFGLSP